MLSSAFCNDNFYSVHISIPIAALISGIADTKIQKITARLQAAILAEAPGYPITLAMSGQLKVSRHYLTASSSFCMSEADAAKFLMSAPAIFEASLSVMV